MVEGRPKMHRARIGRIKRLMKNYKVHLKMDAVW